MRSPNQKTLPKVGQSPMFVSFFESNDWKTPTWIPTTNEGRANHRYIMMNSWYIYIYIIYIYISYMYIHISYMYHKFQWYIVYYISYRPTLFLVPFFPWKPGKIRKSATTEPGNVHENGFHNLGWSEDFGAVETHLGIQNEKWWKMMKNGASHWEILPSMKMFAKSRIFSFWRNMTNIDQHCMVHSCTFPKIKARTYSLPNEKQAGSGPANWSWFPAWCQWVCRVPTGASSAGHAFPPGWGAKSTDLLGLWLKPANNHSWLVVDLPLWKIWILWDDYIFHSQVNGKSSKAMVPVTTNQWLLTIINHH